MTTNKDLSKRCEKLLAPYNKDGEEAFIWDSADHIRRFLIANDIPEDFAIHYVDNEIEMEIAPYDLYFQQIAGPLRAGRLTASGQLRLNPERDRVGEYDPISKLIGK